MTPRNEVIDIRDKGLKKNNQKTLVLLHNTQTLGETIEHMQSALLLEEGQ